MGKVRGWGRAETIGSGYHRNRKCLLPPGSLGPPASFSCLLRAPQDGWKPDVTKIHDAPARRSNLESPREGRGEEEVKFEQEETIVSIFACCLDVSCAYTNNNSE